MKNFRIVIVEDHKLLRNLWATILSTTTGITVIGEAGSLGEALEIVKNTKPDIVLLDINLHGDSGFDAMPSIKSLSPATKIIALSMYNQPEYCKRMLTLGAVGYVTKNSSPVEIFRAIKEAMNGRTYVCDEVKDILTTTALTDEVSGLHSLSAREIEVIQLVKAGFTSKEIAIKINRSFRTVQAHRLNILKKLKLKNTAALIHFIHTNPFSILSQV